ncbi:MAG: hypothetical protein R3349_02890, partial [Geminicoccaceae bacterium]|nr:hypothetical protein [Geminicoccaceae bacterium]
MRAPDEDQVEAAGAAGDDRRIDLHFVPRRLARPAPAGTRWRFARFGLIVLLIAALGAAGVRFGLAERGDWFDGWSEVWQSPPGSSADIQQIQPAGGPLPEETVNGVGPASEMADRAADAAVVEGEPAIPIPSRRPDEVPPPGGSRLAAAGSDGDVVDAGY